MSDEVEQGREPEVEVVPPGSELNSRQRAFVRHYLSDPARNITEAALQAGYGKGNRESAQRMGSYLLANNRVREEIARREAAADTTMQELVGMRVECARNAHLGNVIDVREDGSFDINMLKTLRTGALEWITELRYDRWGRPVIKMTNRLTALEQLDSIFGLKSEPRPNDWREEQKRQKVMMVLDSLRESNPDYYRDFLRRLRENPATRKYVIEVS